MGSEGGPPLRVLLTVHHELVEGTGAPGSTLALSDELRRRGHEVEVAGFELLGGRRGDLGDAIAFPHAVARLVRRRLAAGALDVVDASTGDLAYLGASRARSSRAAVLTRSHGLEPLTVARRRAGARAGELHLRRRYAVYHGGVRSLEVARSLRVADAVLVLNDAEARYVADRGLAARVVRTSPVLAPLAPAATVTPVRDVLVLGPASWRKGGDVAIRVLETLLRADPACTASWYGLDDPAATRRELSDDLAARLEAHGRYERAALPGIVAAHRVLVVASRSEGLPVTVLEALGLGIAVVGTDVAGVRDLLAGGAGRLVPDGHVEGLVGATRVLLDDDDARAACVEHGTTVAAAHAAGPVVDRLVEAYGEVLALKRGR